MFSTIFLLLVVSFYLPYNISGRVKIRNKPAYVTYMERHVRLSRIISAAALVLALILLIQQIGVGAGVFGFIVALMGAGSLVVTLGPFRYLRLAHLFVMYMAFMVFEIFLF